MPGGFLGVDIFFVISGYLITTLLITELAETGRVSISRFYERRARRLLPALLVVMLASLPFAWHYLLPEQLVNFAKSLVSSLLFSSNFYWNYSLQQYGAESALLQPFLHTWSLAVEEQYYILFPLFLCAIYKWGRRYLVAILSFVLVLSLLFAQWMTGHDASFSFYMLPTRLWELLAGSLLALFVLNDKSSTNSISLAHKIIPSIGLILVLGSLVSFGFEVHHPGFITLIPVVGTVLIICFASEGDWVTRALSRPSMVYLGLLSYSLYLWHYPIFAFGRMANLTPSIVHKGGWIVLTLFLSVVSYRLVEKPFRSRRVSVRILTPVFLSTSSLLVLVSLYWIRGDGIPSRGDYVLDLLQSNQPKSVLRSDGANCQANTAGQTIGPTEFCVFDFFPGSPTLVLAGDSHANSLAASVRALAIENQLNFAQISAAGCPHLIGPEWCKQRSEAVRPFLKTLQKPTIIYASHLPEYIEREPFDNKENSTWETDSAVLSARNGLHDLWTDHVASDVVATLTGWVDDGYGLVIVYPVPEQGYSVGFLLRHFSIFYSGADQLPTFSTRYDLFKKRVASSDAALDKVTGSWVRRVYPEKLFCREETGKCFASESDRIYFLGDHHVGVLGSDLIVRAVASELKLQVPGLFRK